MSSLRILGKPEEYKGHYILCQQYGTFFQYIIFKDGNFYSSYSIINDKGKGFTDKQLKDAYKLLMHQAIATVELMINKKDPSKLTKKHEGGAEVAKIIEQANRTVN